MALGHFQRALTDSAGNLLTTGTVTVRRETAGAPKGVLYADRNGATPKANAFALQPGDNGIVDFFAVGGAYRITVVSGALTVDWRYVAIGTAAEQDANAYNAAGWQLQYEVATTTPPGAGCIRFDNANPMSATKAYIDYAALNGISIAALLAGLAQGSKSVPNRILLVSQVDGTGFEATVSTVTDHTTWKELAITPVAGPTSIAEATVLSLQKEMSGLDGSATGNEVTVTATGTTAVGTTTRSVLVKLAAPGSVTLTLPAVAGRNGLPLTISDIAGNATITLTPNGAETIMGDTSATLGPSNGVGLGNATSATISPSTANSGWYQ